MFFDEADVLGSRGGQTGWRLRRTSDARTVRVGEVAQPAGPARDRQLVAKPVQGRGGRDPVADALVAGATASSWAA